MFLYIRQAWLVLLLALCFGVALAGVSTALAPRIEENARIARQTAAMEVFAPVGATEADTAAFLATIKAEETSVDLDGRKATVYKITDESGKMLGWGVPAQGQGYADTIKLVVGVKADKKTLSGVKVIYNQETPGLGNKIVENAFRDQFAGKPADQTLIPAKKAADFAPNEIQAITGATISSKAVCTIIDTQLNKAGLRDKLAADAK